MFIELKTMSQYTAAIGSSFKRDELSALYEAIFNAVKPLKLKLDFGGEYTHRMLDGTSHEHKSNVYKHFKYLYERFGEELELEDLDVTGKPSISDKETKNVPKYGFTKNKFTSYKKDEKSYRILIWSLATDSDLYRRLFPSFKKEVEKIAKVERREEEDSFGFKEKYFLVVEPTTKQLFDIVTMIYERTEGWITRMDSIVPATPDMGKYISDNKKDITYVTLVSDKCSGSISIPADCPPHIEPKNIGLYFQKDISVSSFGEFLDSLMK